MLDLHIAHERFGSSFDLSINGHLHHPHDLDGPLNEIPDVKIRQYRADYNNRPSDSISFMTVIFLLLTTGTERVKENTYKWVSVQ